LLSILLGAGVQILIIESVRRSDLSRTIPLLSFTPVVTMLFGLFVLGEMPGTTQWLGILFVLAGGVGLGLSRVEGATRRTPALDGGSAMMLAAALALAALALQFTAFRGARVGVVETIKRVVGLASSLIAGFLVFRETVTPAKVAALATMAAGVALMLLGSP